MSRDHRRLVVVSGHQLSSAMFWDERVLLEECSEADTEQGKGGV